MSPPTASALGNPVRPRRPVSRDQLMFAAVLGLLLILATILWFKDPSHRQPRPSRIGWPAPAPAKP